VLLFYVTYHFKIKSARRNAIIFLGEHLNFSRTGSSLKLTNLSS